MSRRSLAFVLLALGACSPQAPEGAFTCTDDSDCPSGWSCEPIVGKDSRCYMRNEPIEMGSTVMDASSSVMDASSGPPSRSGNGQTFTPDEAGMYACGEWKAVRSTDAPPAGSTAYGAELQEKGPRPEYLCRFTDTVDDKKVVLQGRGIFGQSCLAVMPAGENVPEHAVASRDFEVFVDPVPCAVWVPYYVSTNLLPTGSDQDGKPTYSCLASVKSPALLPGMSKYLGRFEVEANRCMFEVSGNIRRAPGTPDESFLVLAQPY